MNNEAKQVQIRWRRILFGFHLLMLLVARLAVGSIGEMPPEAIYRGFELWGMLVAVHSVLLAVLDGRDHADLPFKWMLKLIEPRERRWSLLAIDAALWVMVTVAIANRVIAYDVIARYAIPLALLWLAQTAFGMLHLLLVLYAEVRDRSVRRKHKNDEKSKLIRGYGDPLGDPLLQLIDDGELIDFAFEAQPEAQPDEPIQRRSR